VAKSTALVLRRREALSSPLTQIATMTGTGKIHKLMRREQFKDHQLQQTAAE
jgi:hypothetical protein